MMLKDIGMLPAIFQGAEIEEPCRGELIWKKSGKTEFGVRLNSNHFYRGIIMGHAIAGLFEWLAVVFFFTFVSIGPWRLCTLWKHWRPNFFKEAVKDPGVAIMGVFVTLVDYVVIILVIVCSPAILLGYRYHWMWAACQGTENSEVVALGAMVGEKDDPKMAQVLALNWNPRLRSYLCIQALRSWIDVLHGAVFIASIIIAPWRGCAMCCMDGGMQLIIGLEREDKWEMAWRSLLLSILDWLFLPFYLVIIVTFVRTPFVPQGLGPCCRCCLPPKPDEGEGPYTIVSGLVIFGIIALWATSLGSDDVYVMSGGFAAGCLIGGFLGIKVAHFDGVRKPLDDNAPNDWTVTLNYNAHLRGYIVKQSFLAVSRILLDASAESRKE
jgi:hypothetical protein